MAGVTIRATDRLGARTSRLAAELMVRVWPDHVDLFRREMQAYRTSPDLFAPWFALAEKDDEIVGFGLLAASLFATDMDAMRWIAVHPGHRGAGIGRRLVGLCLHEARMRSKPVVLTTSVPVFYEKIGFHRVDEYNPALKHYLMRTD
jgi:N-acetylglutamate synthase-like GNAT family acetyltransferase